MQATAFAAAEKRIWITNPYCTPTDNQVDLLVKAVQRHVDVRLILPGGNNDQPLTKSAGRAAYGKMLEGGVRIFEYQPTMTHLALFPLVVRAQARTRHCKIGRLVYVIRCYCSA